MYQDGPSPYMPGLPGLPELPEIIDARTSGLRLQGTSAKALPGMPVVDYSSDVRAMEAQQYANEMRAAFAITKEYNKRSKAIARMKNRRMENYSKRFGVR